MVGVAAIGCGDGGGGGDTGGGSGGQGGSGPQAVMISFEGKIGDKAFDCTASYPGIGTAPTEATFADFRLYVHDVRLRKKDGSEVPVTLDQDGLWQVDNVALLDFENKTGACANGTAETNTMIMGKAEAGTYDGLSFRLGVPFERNHGDAATAPSPLNLTALFWNWNAGYKFLRVDAMPAGADQAFNVHMGSTGCMADASGKITSCEQPNVAEIELSGFDPLKGKVVVDLAALLADSNLSKDGGGAPGCMAGVDDPECPPIFARLGIDPKDASTHPEQQKLFRAE
jgi:uncharacterized repeat protein (TIGR04052 family)